MGNANRHHAPPYLPPPQPPAPLPVAREVAIPPGGTATATWNLHGGRDTVIEIKNMGPGTCEFDGPVGRHVLRAGRNAVLSVLDGTREFPLEIDSARGTQVRLTVIAWRPAQPPRLIRGVKKSVVRNEKTQLIEAVVQTPCWVVEEAP